MLEILKKSSEKGERFTAISDLQNNEGRDSFQAGNKETQSKVLRASL